MATFSCEAWHGWAAWRPRSWAWWITLANLIGSIAFGVSAVGSRRLAAVPGRSSRSLQVAEPAAVPGVSPASGFT